MGRDYTTSWWNETGRETIPGRTSVGMPVGYIFGESVGNIVGNAVVLPIITCLERLYNLYNVQLNARSAFGVANTGPSHLADHRRKQKDVLELGLLGLVLLEVPKQSRRHHPPPSIPCLLCFVCAHGVCVCFHNFCTDAPST